MSEHILLRLATRKPYRANPKLPNTAIYNASGGYWMIDGEVLVNSTAFRKSPPMSKKADQETGEDIKAQ